MAKSGKTAKKEKKAKKVSAKAKKEVKNEKDGKVRGIVRIAGKDLRGELKLHRALMYIKGIGHSLRYPLARLIADKMGVSIDTPVGSFSDDQIEKINNILFNLDGSVMPSFLLNRRKDIGSGKDLHVIMNDLQFAMRQDIEAKKKSRTWQGYRHMRGKKVRGQRTKNTGRRGLTVGVVRSKGKK